MVLSGALIALIFLAQPGETRDAACEARSRRGLSPGTQFKIEASCQMCACDGANRLFCMPDRQCKDRKEKEYNSRHRRPCMMDGSVFNDLAKVQRDCNICTCRNETWICTEDQCNNGRGRPINTGSNERERSRQDERVRNPERTKQDTEQSTNRGSTSEDQQENEISPGDRSSSTSKNRKQHNSRRKHQPATTKKCVDTDTRCSGIISRRGQDICNSNPVVLKRCPESCGKCKCKDSDARCGDWIRRKGQGVCTSSRYVARMCDETCGKCQPAAEPDVVCEDLDANCAVWAKRANICQRYKYMEKKCQLSCGFCTPPPGVVKKEEEEEEEEGEEEERTIEEENRTDMEKSYIEEWKADLVAKGLLGDTHKPNGCQFRCGGRVYPWGSQFQGDCGLCTCRLRKGTLNDYYFLCSSPTCGEIAPNCEG